MSVDRRDLVAAVAGARALVTDDFYFEDRGKRALVSGGVEQWIEGFRFWESEGAGSSRELIGTAGDRLSIERVAWTRAAEEGALERERLLLAEVDAEGRLRALIAFDPDDRRAAFEEAGARFGAGEAASIGGQAPVVALGRALRRRDWEALRACLADDAVICDRRRPSILGTLDRDQWVGSLKELTDLAPDLAGEAFRILTWNRHGRVHVTRQFGTLDGGSFESLFVAAFWTDGDCIQRYEFFDIGDADQALARFAELCEGGTPSAAS